MSKLSRAEQDPLPAEAVAFASDLRNWWGCAQDVLSEAGAKGVRMRHPAHDRVKQAERTYKALRRGMTDDAIGERYPGVADAWRMMTKYGNAARARIHSIAVAAERCGLDSGVLLDAFRRPSDETIAAAERLAERLAVIDRKAATKAEEEESHERRSAPMSKAELARRILNRQRARPRDVDWDRFDLKPSTSHKWTVSTAGMDAAMRDRVEKPVP